jgi:hypothetical protein
MEIPTEILKIFITAYIVINIMLVFKIVFAYLMIEKDCRKPFLKHCLDRINLPYGDSDFIGLTVVNGYAIFFALTFWIVSFL